MGSWDRDFLSMVDTQSGTTDGASGEITIPPNGNRLWIDISVAGGAAFRYSFGAPATATFGTVVAASLAAKEFSIFKHGTGIRQAISIHAGAAVLVTWTQGLVAS